MKRTGIVCLIVTMLLAHSGCATVVSGKNQDVMIRSTPTGAAVLIDGLSTGITPMMASLERKNRHQIEISKAGYQKATRGTTRGFNWWYLGNLILGGIIGLIVDPITGAIFEVKPESIHVDLANLNEPDHLSDSTVVATKSPAEE